jgi:cytochrome c
LGIKLIIMKKVFFLFSIIFFLSCKNQETKTTEKTTQSPTELGKELFEGKGNCVACHLVDQKIVGPSIQDIAKIYKTKNGNIIDFLKNDAKPIVDPSQYEVMKTNFVITKAMTEQELKAIEAYIYSN